MAADLLPDSRITAVLDAADALLRYHREFIDAGLVGTAKASDAADRLGHATKLLRIARDSAPPIAAPAPSAMARGEDELARVREAWIAARHVVFAAREVIGAYTSERVRDAIDKLRRLVTEYDQRNHDSAPPAAPAAVTERMVNAGLRVWRDYEPEEHESLADLFRRMLQAALAAAASAERVE